MYTHVTKCLNVFDRIIIILIIGILITACSEVNESKSVHSENPLPDLWDVHVSGFWSRNSEAIYLYDMTECRPSNAFAPRLSKGHWKVIPYETTDGAVGNMVWASEETGAPDLTLSLPVQDWHAVFVGIFSSPAAYSTLWFKLDTDPAAVPRRNFLTSFDDNGSAEEVLFKVADLHDNSLVIRQQNGKRLFSGGLVYVKLIPLSEGEISAFLADRNDRSHKTMVATHDGVSPHIGHLPTSKEHLLSEVEIFRDTDFGTILLEGELHGVSWVYGDMIDREDADFLDADGRLYSEIVKILESKNIDPIKVLIDGAHEIGMKAFVGLRPGNLGNWHEPFAGQEPPFYTNNPGWRCVDRDGTPVVRVSWAVPEVRKHFIDRFGELLSLGADGVHVILNRAYPVVLYEKPYVKMFMDKYGEDPRELDESDPRIVGLWTDIVTTFFRELREKLDEEEVRRGDGRHLEIGATVLGNGEFNLQYGVDVGRLIDEGLLDEVYPFKWNWGAVKFGTWDFTHGTFMKKYNSINYELDYFKNACGKKGVPFKPYFWKISDIEKCLDRAVEYYEAGAVGISNWDALSRLNSNTMYEWIPLCRMGHIEETKARAQREIPKKTYLYFHRLGDYIMDGRFPPNWGG